MTNACSSTRWSVATQAELDRFGFEDPYDPRFVHAAVFGTKMSCHPMRWPDVDFRVLAEVNPDVVGWVRMGRDFSRQAALFAADPDSGLVARPGQSEHQTGLALDVGTWRGPFLSDANARHRTWVAERCWDYGLIIRYPQGREHVTGVPAEPWHLRYVGRDVALEMRERGWVLEEWHEAHA